MLLPGIDAVKYKAHARLTVCQTQLLHLKGTPVFVVVAKTAMRQFLTIVDRTDIAENTCQHVNNIVNMSHKLRTVPAKQSQLIGEVVPIDTLALSPPGGLCQAHPA